MPCSIIILIIITICKKEVVLSIYLYFLLQVERDFVLCLLRKIVVERCGTAVLYQMMIAITGQAEVTLKDFGLGMASFFVVSLGGVVVGVSRHIFTAVNAAYLDLLQIY